MDCRELSSSLWVAVAVCSQYSSPQKQLAHRLRSHIPPRDSFVPAPTRLTVKDTCKCPDALMTCTHQSKPAALSFSVRVLILASFN